MLITEISEKDFRKLDIVVWRKERIVHDRYTTFDWFPFHINDILDEHIRYCLEKGYKEDELSLTLPVTIAIHVNNDNKEDRENVIGGGYWDKFLNRFSGEATYEIGFGIPHLYSTRDYYECRDGDYWRVRKKETEVIYRVHLEPRDFVLKHKEEIVENFEDGAKVAAYFTRNEDGDWVEDGDRVVIKRNENGSTTYIPLEKYKAENN